ncbi:tetratricopeptide repeat protein [Streptomyces kutzneri]|uniref:tetratricopeptide repeat protein n=1 Tax=Streptomyces kutzneri TaxID=3051179 RepID=UPI0028D42800|nr:tetratricopeptide repeat protein [Streptomyces sp. DSM 40907]
MREQRDPDAADARVAVTGTGNATAASGATAVTGYRGPAPGTGGFPDVPVRVSGTGDANAAEGAFANTGHIGQMHVGKLNMVQQRTPREPAAWPHQVGVIPSRARSFQQRAEAQRLHTTGAGGDTALPCQVLTGMGGVGKTQLAAGHAHAAWLDGALDVLVWVSADARPAVVAGYAKAGVELCRADPNDAEGAAASFLAWLEPKPEVRPCRWLVVLDDVADPSDLRGLWPPASPHGRVLVTTRRRDAALAGNGRRLMEVSLFTPAEAVAYLSEMMATHGRTEPDDQLAALAADLGNLPLALAQAAAYLADSGMTVAAYRALLTDSATALADAAPDTLPDDQKYTAAAALTLSLDRADTLRPVGLARPLLLFAAFLDPNGIPDALLTSTPFLNHLSAQRTCTGTTDRPPTLIPVTADAAVAALRALYRLHLVEHTPDTPYQAVRVHQLIQRAVCETLTAGQRDAFARTAADALTDVWPAVERDTNLAQALRANATTLTDHAEDALYRPGAHPVLYRVGRSLGESGQVAAARDHFQHLADSARRLLGPDHPDTLAARDNLAWWQGRSGDTPGTVAAFTALLDDQLRVLGADHPDTLITRHHLARWRGEAGDAAVDAAVAATAELLEDQLRVLGPDHPATLETRHGLARWRAEAGDVDGAVAAFAELLEDQLRVLGADHPDTLTTRHGLAWWRGRAGDAPAAAAAFADLLADRLRVLGPDHPATLTTRFNLAWWLWAAGDEQAAVEVVVALLADRVRVLGEDHPETVRARESLARWRTEIETGGRNQESKSP